jgi:cyclic beta-1,2-glucan synthetase
VGIEGEGESIWLAWFTITILDEMSALTEAHGDSDRAARYRAHAARYREALQKSGWDGKWYRRAFTDTGAPIGTSNAKAFRIDSVAQSWAYFANGKTKESLEALQSAKHELGVNNGHVPLAWPPSSRSVLDMGTITDYPPGVRENASQYNHAALWLAQALFASGDPDGGMAVVNAVNPFKRSDTAPKSLVYQGEPYVVAAEVLSAPTYPGRAGWTWYTASAGVLYRTICEYILGIKREGNTLSFAPSFPTGWHHASVILSHGKAHYQIKFEATADHDEAVEILEDGIALTNKFVTMIDDKRVHEIIVRFKG